MHARLSPSNLHWPHCPGSVREEAKYPDISGEAAIDGTGTHILLEMCVKCYISPDYYIGEIIGPVNHHDKPNGWMVKADRAARVSICLNYISQRVRELKEKYGPDCKVVVESESKANPGRWFFRDDWYGTCDVTISVIIPEPGVLSFGHLLYLEVIDYKDGRGWVDVNNNTQLLSYLFGKFIQDKNLGHADFRMTIVQPKTSNPIRFQNLTSGQLNTKGAELNIAAKKTDDPNAPLIPDDKGGKGYCQWCKHKPNCKALREKKMDLINKETNTLFELFNKTINSVKLLTSMELAELNDARSNIESIFDEVKKESEKRINNNESIPGYEMRPGRSSKVWNEDEETIAKILRSRKFKNSDIYPPKLISPPQLLKSDLLKKEQKERIEKKYISVKVGKDILTKVSYKDPKVLFDNVLQSKTTKLSLDTSVSFI